MPYSNPPSKKKKRLNLSSDTKVSDTKLATETKNKVMELNKWFCHDYENSIGWRDRALRNYALVESDPEAHFGSASLLRILRMNKIPANVWNLIAPKIELLSALANGDPLDIKTSARGYDDDAVNDAMNSQIKYVQDINNIELEIATWFDDAAICGLGMLEAFQDEEYSEDYLFGDIYIGRVFPLCFVWDKSAQRYDLQDARQITKAMWLDQAAIQKNFKNAPDFNDSYYRAAFIDDSRLGQFKKYSHYFYDKNAKTTRVLNTFYKEKQPVYVVINVAQNEAQAFWDEGQAREVAKEVIKITGSNKFIRVLKKETNRVKLCIHAGDQLLEERWADENHNLYRFIPIFGKKFSDKMMGMVDDLHDPQLEINKRMSQSLQVTSKNVNAPLFIPNDSIADEDIIKLRDGKPNLVIGYDSTKGKPHFEQQAQIPTALVDIINTSRTMMDMSSGIQPELAGQTQGVAVSGVPGKAVNARQQGSILSVSRYTRNLAVSKKILGKHIVKLIQQYHPPEKMLRIIGQTKNQVGQVKALLDSGMQSALYKLQSAGLIPFDIVVDLSQKSTTTRQAQFLQAMQLTQVGIPVPGRILIELADIPMKEEVNKELATKGMQPPNPAIQNVVNQAQGAQDGGTLPSS